MPAPPENVVVDRLGCHRIDPAEMRPVSSVAFREHAAFVVDEDLHGLAGRRKRIEHEEAAMMRVTICRDPLCLPLPPCHAPDEDRGAEHDRGADWHERVHSGAPFRDGLSIRELNLTAQVAGPPFGNGLR